MIQSRKKEKDDEPSKACNLTPLPLLLRIHHDQTSSKCALPSNLVPYVCPLALFPCPELGVGHYVVPSMPTLRWLWPRFACLSSYVCRAWHVTSYAVLYGESSADTSTVVTSLSLPVSLSSGEACLAWHNCDSSPHAYEKLCYLLC